MRHAITDEMRRDAAAVEDVLIRAELARVLRLEERAIRGPAQRGAFRRGWHAFLEGENVCPYLDKRTDRGHVTFSRAYARLWREGYRRAASARGSLKAAI